MPRGYGIVPCCFDRHQLDAEILGDLLAHAVTDAAPLTSRGILEVPRLAGRDADAQLAALLDLLPGRRRLLRQCDARCKRSERESDDHSREYYLAHAAHLNLLGCVVTEKRCAGSVNPMPLSNVLRGHFILSDGKRLRVYSRQRVIQFPVQVSLSLDCSPSYCSFSSSQV